MFSCNLGEEAKNETEKCNTKIDMQSKVKFILNKDKSHFLSRQSEGQFIGETIVFSISNEFVGEEVFINIEKKEDFSIILNGAEINESFISVNPNVITKIKLANKEFLLVFKKEYSLSLQEVADSIVKIIETKVRSNKSINVLLPSHYALLSINGDTLENYERLLEYDFLNQTVRVAFRISRLSDGMNLLQSHSFSFDFDEENREQIDNDATDDAQIIINNTAHSLLIYGIGIGSKQSALVSLFLYIIQRNNPAGLKLNMLLQRFSD